jgi:hypothetical protein
MTARHVRTNRIARAAGAAAIALWAGCGSGGGSTTILPDGGVVVDPTCDHKLGDASYAAVAIGSQHGLRRGCRSHTIAGQRDRPRWPVTAPLAASVRRGPPQRGRAQPDLHLVDVQMLGVLGWDNESHPSVKLASSGGTDISVVTRPTVACHRCS